MSDPRDGIAHDRECEYASEACGCESRTSLRAAADEMAAALERLTDEMQVVYSSGDPRPASWFESRIKRARAALSNYRKGAP